MSSPRGESLLEEGLVLSLQPGNPGPATARVRLLAGSHCEGCPAAGVCRPGGEGDRTLEVLDRLGARPGDRVRIRVMGSAVLKASFLIYGLPLLLLLIGVGIGTKLWPAGTARGDLLSFGLGALLAAVAAPLAAWFGRRMDRGNALSPEIVEIITN